MSGITPASHKVRAYIELLRFDKPVGIELLLWPTLWAVLLASLNRGSQPQLPDASMWVIFTLGAIGMRAAGCAINDFADRNVDGYVTRTQSRPLADGRLLAKEALLAFVVMLLLSASLLFWLPLRVLPWALAAAALACLYPFTKRWTHLPQLVLAAAFGFAIPMAYVAILGHTNLACWLLFFGYLCWTVAYDTQYAMADRSEDLAAGIKSTAILFGRYDILIIAVLQISFMLSLLGVFWLYFAHTSLGMWPLLAVAPLGWLFAKQNQRCGERTAKACLSAFLANVWVGRYVFVVTLLACLWLSLA